MKLIMTKGLPASGKSTWAKKYVRDNPNWIRINKDDLRAMLHDSVHSKGRENFVLEVRNETAAAAIRRGLNVIIDDTNFNPIHQENLTWLCSHTGADFEVKDFTDVPVEECIKRDAQRVNSVGKKVIMTMYNQYLKKDKQAPVIEYDEELPDCYIFDIDGTLAKMGDRGPFDWKKVGLDTPNVDVVKLARIFGRTNGLVIFSGRDSVCRPETEKWLAEQDIRYDNLVMRPEGDMRKDSIVKQEFYEEHIKYKYNVLGVFDDRNQVVEMWRSLGLTCFQVAEGDF